MKTFSEELTNLVTQVTKRPPENDLEDGFRAAVMLLNHHWKNDSTVRPIIVNGDTKTITIRVECTNEYLYSYIKQLFQSSDDYIKFPFPFDNFGKGDDIETHLVNDWKIIRITDIHN